MKELTQNLELAKRRKAARGRDGEGPLGQHCAREKKPRRRKESDGSGDFGDLGHGAWAAEVAGLEKRLPTRCPGRGLYAPESGSLDALNVAPDASGDHRTHAQRGMQIDISPDDGHRTRALASGALGHAR